jgi:hypothetical protein
MFKFILLAFFASLLGQEKEPALVWNKDVTLQWSDFKGEPKSSEGAVASTASGISFGFSTTKTTSGLIDYSYTITAHFYPDKSWHINKVLSNNVLAHERLHFDITELYARKFRQRVSNASFTNDINIEMERIHNAINTELSEFQQQYDAETNHSQHVDKQIAWQTLIATKLNKLSNYGN